MGPTHTRGAYCSGSPRIDPDCRNWTDGANANVAIASFRFPQREGRQAHLQNPETPVRQASCSSKCCATMPKASWVLAALTPNPCHSQRHPATLAPPPKTGGRDSKTRCCDEVCAHQPAPPRVVPAGDPSAGYGGRCVGALRPPAIITHRFSSHASSATFIGGGFCLYARSQP